MQVSGFDTAFQKVAELGNQTDVKRAKEEAAPL
jgi:hypothetical protein